MAAPVWPIKKGYQVGSLSGCKIVSRISDRCREPEQQPGLFSANPLSFHRAFGSRLCRMSCLRSDGQLQQVRHRRRQKRFLFYSRLYRCACRHHRLSLRFCCRRLLSCILPCLCSIFYLHTLCLSPIRSAQLKVFFSCFVFLDSNKSNDFFYPPPSFTGFNNI